MADPIVATKPMIEELFDGAAERYDREGPRVFGKFGVRLVEWMNIQPGMRGLDVATGKGAVLIPAAQRVGAKGHVIGIDLSNVMVEQTAIVARELGLSNVEMRKMDAEHLEFADASFDFVTCAFALFLFPSMNIALNEMQRVLKKGGRIGITMWGKTPSPFDPAWKIFVDQVRAYNIEVRMPQKIAYATTEVESTLADAGFGGIKIDSETSEVVYPSEEDWWAFQLTNGSRAAIYRMDEVTRAKFKEEYLAKLRQLFQGDGLHLGVNVVYAQAQLA